jgi:hypothetical protein
MDGKIIRRMFTYTDFIVCFIIHILISLTIFMGTPNSMRILYNTSLVSELNHKIYRSLWIAETEKSNDMFYIRIQLIIALIKAINWMNYMMIYVWPSIGYWYTDSLAKVSYRNPSLHVKRSNVTSTTRQLQLVLGFADGDATWRCAGGSRQALLLVFKN